MTVNFDSDSVLGGGDRNSKEGPTSSEMPSPASRAAAEKEAPNCSLPGWVYREGIRNTLPGFHLRQHCQCVYTDTSTLSEAQPSVKVSAMQYSVDLGL